MMTKNEDKKEEETQPNFVVVSISFKYKFSILNPNTQTPGENLSLSFFDVAAPVLGDPHPPPPPQETTKKYQGTILSGIHYLCLYRLLPHGLLLEDVLCAEVVGEYTDRLIVVTATDELGHHSCIMDFDVILVADRSQMTQT